MAGRRKRRESRELPFSSRQSRLTNVGEINSQSPAIFLSRTALSRDKLTIATLARHGRPSRSQGTFSSNFCNTCCRLRVVRVIMRVNAPRDGTILQVKKDEKRRPGAFTTIPGRFLKRFRGLWSPGRYVKQEKRQTPLKRGEIQKIKKKAHTSQTRGDTKNQEKKPTPLTHTARARQQQVLIMSQPSSTDKAPITDKSTGDQSKLLGKLASSW